MADPGFPTGGCTNPRGGDANIWSIFPKICIIMKKFRSGAWGVESSLNPPMSKSALACNNWLLLITVLKTSRASLWRYVTTYQWKQHINVHKGPQRSAENWLQCSENDPGDWGLCGRLHHLLLFSCYGAKQYLNNHQHNRCRRFLPWPKAKPKAT